MVVEFDKSFEKSLGKIKDKTILPKIEKTITILEATSSLSVVSNIKKLSGFKNYYRLRIGDYRIGIEQISVNIIRLIIIAHRKDIYKTFP